MSIYSVFVESMKRLYQHGRVSAETVLYLFSNNKITAEEKDYILNAR